MPISWDSESQQFHLRSDSISYVMRVLDNGWLGQLYFGSAIAEGNTYSYLGPAEFLGFSNRLGDPIPLEYPTGGSGDFRIPALVVEQADGSTVLDLRYKSHRVVAGKPPTSLPSTYVEVGGEAETLEIVLADTVSGVEVELRYTLYRNRPVVVRGARIVNRGSTALIVRAAMSASLDISDSDWTLITLDGEWARERHIHRTGLRPGRQSVASNRGTSSSQHNPFIALARPSTTEDQGEVIGFSLAYSGNFLAEVEVEPFGSTRVRLGINPEGFSWLLDPEAAFEAPEAILVYSANGLDEMSQAYHDLLRTRMARGAWRDKARPILLNS
ncbi:MAG: glycoside hydrolase family 36 N-terminal domain-containing protein, partial [Isosphaeraceae bacterium]